MAVRVATPADIGRMVELSAAKRAQYARYAPVFWRQAEDADEKQARYFAALLENERYRSWCTRRQARSRAC